MTDYLKISVLILMTAFLFGCEREGVRGDGTDGQLISFSTAAGKSSTKSGGDIEGIIQDAVFPTDRNFVMNTFRLDFDENGNPVMTGGYIFMNMETISYNSTDKLWHTSEPYYWPLSGGLYCLGFYPSPDTLKSHKMLEGMTADHYGTLLLKGYSIKHTDQSNNPITDDDSKTDANLGHARVDFMTSTSIVDDVQTRASNTVPVDFTHTLAQLKFSIETDKDYSSRTFYQKVGTAPNDTNWYWIHWQQMWIDGIKLTNVHSKATYSHSAPHWPGDKLSELYTYYPLRRDSRGGTLSLFKIGESGTPQDVLADAAYFGTRKPVQTQVTTDGSNPLCILLIPQRFPDDATIEITVTTRILNMLSPDKNTNPRVMNDNTFSSTKSFLLKDILPILTGGNCVNIKFITSMEDISVGLVYEEWEEGSSSEPVM